MITLDNCQWIAPIGTAGEWLIRSFEKLGLGSFTMAEATSPFNGKTQKLFQFGLVRHPVDWLETIFELLSGRDRGFYTPILAEFSILETKDLDSFAYQYSQLCPGAIGRFFGRHVCDSVVKCEDLPAGLYFAFDLVQSGIPQAQWGLKPLPRHHRKMDRSRQRLVMQNESNFVETYEYF